MITIVFDTETTGLIKPSASEIDAQPYITEIYCVKVEQSGPVIKTIGEFEHLIKVPVPLTEEITRITGLTDAMLENEPTFAEVLPDLAEFFTGVDRLVAHNLAFDRAMLANEVHRCGKILKFPWPRDQICTVEKSLHIEQRRMNLTRLYEHLFGARFHDAHRAKSDVMALLDCYKEMVSRRMI